MHHSEQKCAYFCYRWCMAGCGAGAMWDLWDWSISRVIMITRPHSIVNCMMWSIWLSMLDAFNSNMSFTGWYHTEHKFKCDRERLESKGIHQGIQHIIHQEHRQQARVDFQEPLVSQEVWCVPWGQERRPTEWPIAYCEQHNNGDQVEDGFQRSVHPLAAFIDGIYGGGLQQIFI